MWPCVPQLLSSRLRAHGRTTGPVCPATEVAVSRARAQQDRSHAKRNPRITAGEEPLLAATRESLHAEMKTQPSQK